MPLPVPLLSLLLLLAPSAPQEEDLVWRAAAELTLEGQAWKDVAAPFDRLPARAETLVRGEVWRLSRDSAGLSVRFRSDAPEIHVRWSLGKSELALPHMPATGASGVDLYVLYQSKSRWLATGQPRGTTNRARLVHGLLEGTRDYELYLPLYNQTTSLEIGVPAGATLEPLAREDKLPVVFYGTSITQGACASRPGMTHVAQLGRRLGRPVINLGFSGNGQLDPELGVLLAEIDAAAYVLDCVPNMDAGMIRERTVPFVQALRKARPAVPILLVEDRSYAHAFLRPDSALKNHERRVALLEVFETLTNKGVQHLHYLGGGALLGVDGEATVDGSHPTDLGFTRQADVFMSALPPILGRK